MPKKRHTARILLGCTFALLASSCSSLTSTVTRSDDKGNTGNAVTADFEGNESISRFQLFRRIEDLLYDFSRKPDAESAIFDAALAIDDFYRSEGFPRVSTGYRILPPYAGGTRRVVFEISEGGLVVIDSLEIRGNHSIQDPELKRFLPEKSSSSLGFGRPIFVERILEGFASDIRTRYAQDGYLNVEVDGPLVEYIEEGKAVRVVYDVREGPLFSLHALEIHPDLLNAAEGWQPEDLVGQPFGREVASKVQLGLRKRLRSLGYPHPKIQAIARPVAGQETKVDLVVRGTTGPKTVIGEIAIEGNEKTRDYVIRGRIHLKEGELFDGDLEDESLRRLYRTGLFRKVTVRYEPIDGDEYRAVFVVEEIPSQEIQFLVGYGSYELGRLGARFEEANLFGTGLDLIWHGKVSFKDIRTGITVVDPEVFVPDLRLSVGAEWFRREEPSYVDKGYLYNLVFDKPLFENLHGRLGYEFSSREGSKVDVPEIDPSLEDYAKGEIFGDLLWDERDNVIVTRSGRTVTFRAAYASEALGGDIEFWRLSGKFVQYFPITQSTRIVTRYETTALFPQQGSDRIPLQERVFSGGSTTVRSYAYKELGPKSVNGEPLGGEFRQVVSAELRFPLPFPLPLLGPTEAAVFVDAGNVGPRVEDWGFDDLKYALGMGLRYSLPFILRFDAGYNPDRDEGDSVWAFHLTIGTPF